MKKIVIRRLFQSFVELERAIVSATATLAGKSNPPKELIERIRQYEEILDKQRTLATVLCGHAALGNWPEVQRHVKLINALSLMIRDDAREVLSGYHPQNPPEERQTYAC